MDSHKPLLLILILTSTLAYLVKISLFPFPTKNLTNNEKSLDNSNSKTTNPILNSSASFNESTMPRHDKWIVMTSIDYPQVTLTECGEFKLIAVSDLKTSSKWSWRNKNSTTQLYYLGVQSQKELGFQLANLTPFNSHTRKNLGYLLAIRKGAQFIYDTDDVPTTDPDSYFNFKQQDLGLVYDYRVSSTDRVLNVYAHFGQPAVWARGFPLSAIDKNFNNSYLAGVRKRSAIQHGLVNENPDLAAKFVRGNSEINLQFDLTAPSLKLPRYRMSPFNSKNTLFTYEAFWALYLPGTLTACAADVIRAYWAQRLMWLINETVSFHTLQLARREVKRKPASLLCDYKAEKIMNSQTERLIKFLFDDWKCKLPKFYDCVLDLASQMARKGFWMKEEVDMIKLWLSDLNSAGYSEPKMANAESTNLADEYKIGSFDYTPVRFTPNFQTPPGNLDDTKSIESRKRLESFNFLKSMCKSLKAKLDKKLAIDAKKKRSKFNFSLLVTFNQKPIEENIVILNHVYREHFEHVIFCGVNITRMLARGRGANKKMLDSYTFIEFDTGRGMYHYDCMSKAIELNLQRTAGVLLLSDDVMLKFWKLSRFDTNKFWYVTKDNYHVFNEPGDRVKWSFGAQNFENLVKLAVHINSTDDDVLKSFRNNFNGSLHHHLTQTKSLFHVGGDVFYVPRSLFQRFHLISTLFRRFEVYLEVAVPYILTGLDPSNSMERMSGKYYWGDAKFRFDPDYAHPDAVYYHPFKLSWLKKRSRERFAVDYCRRHVSDKYANGVI
jgi:hypothetical protein